MPPRKRKASAKSTEPAKKKVRVSETVPVEDPAKESLPTRPKRISLAKGPAGAGLDAPKRRGRPSKASNTAVSKTEDIATPQKSVRGRPPTKEVDAKYSSTKTTTPAVQNEPEQRKRGRPRKLDTASIVKEEPARGKAVAATKKQSTPKTTKNLVKDVEAAPKGTAFPRKRGRPPKVAFPRKRGRPFKVAPTPTATIVQDINAQHLSGADDDGEATDLDEHGDRQYWLMKAEPLDRFENGVNVKFSIDDLAAADAPEPWDGVRNYSARNNMRAMRQNDLAFFYHSNCPVPGIVGVMRIAQEHTPDRSAFDPNHPYYDPKSDPKNPKWDCVHVEFVKKFDIQITLKMLQENKARGGELADMQLLRMGRLSVSAVKAKEWRYILELAGEKVDVGEDGDVGGDKAKGVVDGYESDTDGEVNGGPREELNGDLAAGNLSILDGHAEAAIHSENKDVTAE